MLDAYRLYRFPANSRAEALTLKEQIEYAIGELQEALEALARGANDEAVGELWDALQTIEGAHRKFKFQKVWDGYLLTVAKCSMRGNYSMEAMCCDDWGLV